MEPLRATTLTADASKEVSRYHDVEGCKRAWTLILRAVKTHDVLPGRTRASLVSDIDLIRDMNEAYGYTQIKPPRFMATPRDVSNWLQVFGWLNWLRRQPKTGGRDFKILLARARGVAWWRLTLRFGRSEQTIRRWADGAIAAIYSKFDLEVWTMEPDGD